MAGREDRRILRGTIAASLAVVAVASGLSAQDVDVEFDRISIEQGLSQSIVEGMTQDRHGFMWFITEDGLNRYDGYSFTVYRNEPGNPATLSHNELKALHEDRDGVLWVGTFAGGLNRFDPSTERVTRFAHDPLDPQSLALDTVRCILEDADGRLWVGTQGGGLDRLDRTTGRFTHHRHDPSDSWSLPGDDVRALLEDSRGRLWVGTLGGLARREADGGFTRLVHVPDDATSLVDNRVLSLLQVRRGDLWVGTAAGLDIVDPDTLAVRQLELPAGAESVHAMVEDHTGAVWLASDGGGVGRVDPGGGAIRWYRNDPLDPGSLSADRVWSLFQDRSHVLWAGTYGGGLSRYDVARKRFGHVRHDPDDAGSLSDDIVWCFWEDPDGTLWVGTDSGGLNRRDPVDGRWAHLRHDPSDPETLGSDTVRALWRDRSGRLWIATNGGGLSVQEPGTARLRHYRHDPSNPGSLGTDDLRSVMQDSSGAIWISTFGAGLDRLDPESGEITHYPSNPADPGTLASGFLRLVYEDSRGDLWIGTQGGGVSRLDRSTGRFTTLRFDPGDPSSLSNDHVFAIHESRDGSLWFGTFGGGLNRFDRETGRCEHFRETDGLACDSVYAILEDDAGRLWVSTTAGLSRFDPASGAFRNFDVRDGLQGNEFNGGAAYRGRDGKLYFGGINGFNVFVPEEIGSNPVVPQVVLTELQLFNRTVVPGQPLDDGRVLLDRPLTFTDRLVLSYRDTLFSLEFAALHFSASSKNRYRYTLSGFDDRWIPVSADHRLATFTGLAPGDYVFRVQGSNADGLWNEVGASLRIAVEPPYWATWWFRLLILGLVAAVAAVIVRARMRSVRMKAELHAAHDAQMAIMPQTEVEVPGFEISGLCRPAHEVGGDFFDVFWTDHEPRRLCVVVGDAAGKAMTAAMTAVMSDGMVVSRAHQPGTVADIMGSLNRTLHAKVPKRMFTALSLLVLDPATRRLELANAGLCNPLLRTGRGVEELSIAGPRYPLGRFADTAYLSRTVVLEPGDVVVAFTDGVPEARTRSGDLYGYEAPRQALELLDTEGMSAAEIVEALLDDVRRCCGGGRQQDDLTIVVIAARADS